MTLSNGYEMFKRSTILFNFIPEACAGPRRELSVQREAQLVNTIAAMRRTLERNDKDKRSAVPASKYRQASVLLDLGRQGRASEESLDTLFCCWQGSG